MREFVAGLVTLGSAFITAGIVYQIVKNPAVPTAALSTTTSLAGDLFKG